MTIGWCFDNTYSKLPDPFREKIDPVPVKNPELVILNKNLSKELNLDFSNIDNNKIAELFSGNSLPPGSNSIAQAYAGHQFGHFTMLGDGRAVLIGEHLSKKKDRYDIQFKGSGKTTFSRNGDGRAALGPMLREYIISEAMHNLNIPTTRSLAVVKTGEDVVREKPLQGAILTRVALSHIRVGTFQYIAARDKKNELEILLNYVIQRHYPNIQNSKNKAIDLLKVVMEKQINLVVNWMRVGFIHGVMNTDNMSISGETIDYGPCAFMDTYDPKTVFSSIDHLGRYAYCNQPLITKWNLTRFAECLIPLIHNDQNKSIEIATETLNSFEKKYEEKWLNMMRDKLGLFGSEDNDKILILDLLTWMHQKKTDYTNTFCHLMGLEIDQNDKFQDDDFQSWKERWQKRHSLNNKNYEKCVKLMRSVNPLVIPRNIMVENALKDADKGNFDSTKKIIGILSNPYLEQKDIINYQAASLSNKNYKTFCGT